MGVLGRSGSFLKTTKGSWVGKKGFPDCDSVPRASLSIGCIVQLVNKQSSTCEVVLHNVRVRVWI